MTSVAPQIAEQTTGELRIHSVDFGDSAASSDLIDGKLDIGELLTGTLTAVVHAISPTTATALTLANKAVSTVSIVINGRTAIAGEAGQFSATGGSAGSLQTIRLSAASDATPAQTLEGYVKIRVKAVST